MLRLNNIVKDYVMKDQESVHALKGVSVNFRRNEFVAILGPSGCGKTTLLNIIGGLDRYTSGDLIIQGVSTKDYKDGDWDTYRNHSIGFVFQSYNLIAHSNILSNVELALTISGIDKKERRERATKALETVGLKGMEKKKPNQLSGGQMQRVAIARALVNNPEILLADEPTGALDSETSVQIMDLLKEVAKDRLVIMVTHNPDLAEQYATRIVTMKDGLLTGDSNPYQGESDKERKAAQERVLESKGNKKQTSMSFATATGLSFFNLLSKLKRTILVSIAGSIGIIGVSAVLSVSNGVHMYIDDMQEDLISRYPVTISETAVDYTSLLEGLTSDQKREIVEFALDHEVGLDSLINYLMDKYKDITDVKTNDINDDLMMYLHDLEAKGYTHTIQNSYAIDVTNNIYTNWSRDFENTNDYYSLNGLTQMYISELRTVENFGEYATFVDLFTDFMKEIPDNKEYVLSQYDILAGTYPSSASDIVLVTDENQTLTDLIYAQMGYFNEKEFLNLARKAIEEHSDNPDPEKIKKYDEGYHHSFTFAEILNKKFKYYPHDEMYSYGTAREYEVIKFSPVIKSGSSSGIETDFKLHYEKATEQLEGTIALSNYEINCVFTHGDDFDESKPFSGTWKGDVKYASFSLDITLKFNDDNTVDVTFDIPTTYDKLADNQIEFLLADGDSTLIATYDENLDMMMGQLTMGSYTLDIPISRVGEHGESYLGEWVLSIPSVLDIYFGIDEEYVTTHLYNTVDTTTDIDKIQGFYYQACKNDTEGTEMHVSCILKKKKDVQFGCLQRGVYYTKDLSELYMKDAEHSKIIEKGDNNAYSLIQYIKTEQRDRFKAYVTYEYSSFAKGDMDNPKTGIKGYANCINSDLSSSITNLFSVRGTTALDANKSALRSLSGIAAKELPTESTVHKSFEFKKLPKTISIYPKDFDNKKKVTNYLTEWNEDKDITLSNGTVLSKDERQELTYTDTVELIISIINTMINIITIALVSFTSLALVVSCFMITVITYISTMERVKEIGIIRSLGGRKKDVSRLFIAECLIIGLASGLIGIGVTYIISLTLNVIIANVAVGVSQIANLPIWTAGIMVALSISLNVISGFIPARSASKQDPVIALRTE